MYLLIYEKNTLCMLPAPLNLLTVALAPIHWYYTRWNVQRDDKRVRPVSDQLSDDRYFISVPGTCADIVLGLIASVVAPFYELSLYWHRVAMKRDTWKIVWEVISMTSLCLLLYPFFVFSLMAETCYRNRTYVKIDPCDDGFDRCLVKFTQKEDEVGDSEINKNDNIISIKIIRGSFKNSSSYSNIHIRIKIGSMVRTSGPALYPGKDCMWVKEVLEFPITTKLISELLADNATHLIKKDQMKNQLMTITALDIEPVTQGEKFVGQCLKDYDIKEWIANKRMEGQIKFDDGVSNLSVYVKIKFSALINMPIAGINEVGHRSVGGLPSQQSSGSTTVNDHTSGKSPAISNTKPLSIFTEEDLNNIFKNSYPPHMNQRRHMEGKGDGHIADDDIGVPH